ncbi:YceD family protein [Pseudonocardia hispaniensis]|uniref:YceD family protein n=1 Tax=Pseudonocardia hispaniensis TaxID=904933 RepID=A0ABW1J426_9PSEU
MTTHRTPTHRPEAASPWVFSTRELGRRPGAMRTVSRSIVAPDAPGVIGIEGVIAVPAGSPMRLELRLEAVTEGVYVSGTVSAELAGECARCLDPMNDALEVAVAELFAYPDSITEETTDADEVPRLVDELIDLEPTVRDTIILELPLAPLCSPDCLGLCPGCGGRRADLGPDHGHERLDPRWAALREHLPSE